MVNDINAKNNINKSDTIIIAILESEYKAMKENLKMMKGNRGFKKLLKNQIKSGNFGLDESMFNS